MAVVGPGRSLRVELYRKRRVASVTQALDRVVVEIDMRYSYDSAV